MIYPCYSEDKPLAPGMLLYGDQYRLLERKEYQQWVGSAYEKSWTAQDMNHASRQIIICELMLPESRVVIRQTHLRAAIKALLSIGDCPHIPTLENVFKNHGRDFFAFDTIPGHSLLARVYQAGQVLPEQEIIECCLQITGVLELFSRQSPPLIHGLISPEHIVKTATGPYWMLTNPSLVMASGAIQFIPSSDRNLLSPYTAPEFGRGEINVRSDLYALLATAYYAVTGYPPAGRGKEIPRAQWLNASVSSQFDAILMKGLHPVASQRYQQPSELHQELLAMHSAHSTTEFEARPGQTMRRTQSTSWERQLPDSPTVYPGSSTKEFRMGQVQATMTSQPAIQGEQSFMPLAPGGNIQESFPQTTIQNLFLSTPHDTLDEQEGLLPDPEELPPIPRYNHIFATTCWVAGIFICLSIPFIILRL